MWIEPFPINVEREANSIVELSEVAVKLRSGKIPLK